MVPCWNSGSHYTALWGKPRLLIRHCCELDGSGPAGVVLNIRASVSWTHSWPTVYHPRTPRAPAADHAAARAPDWLTRRTPLSMIGWRRKHELGVLKYVNESKFQKQWQYWSEWDSRQFSQSDTMQHQYDIHIETCE